MREQILNIISASISVKQQILQSSALIQLIEKISDVITDAFLQGNRVYFCGNGGSAADAQHLAAEFSGRFYKDRKTLPAEALHGNSSYLTAVANDFGYDEVYSRLISGIGQTGDVLVAISTSGNSASILNALAAAKQNKMKTVGMTGAEGEKMKLNSDYLVNVPSSDTPRIQESHIMIGHIICQLVEEKLYPSAP